MLSQLVIVSGMSGSGKSTALHALEDIDFYAVDNLPIRLFEKLSELIVHQTEITKLAIVMDLRDSEFAKLYPQVLGDIQQNFPHVEILFLDSADDVLTRRFSETRRKHPL